MGNKGFAQQIAQFADVLAEYDHLPQLDMVHTNRSGRIMVGSYDDPLRVLAAWAAAFDQPITLALGVNGYIKTTMPVSGFRVMFEEIVEPSLIHRIAVALEVLVTPADPSRVSPEGFVSALDAVESSVAGAR